MSYYEYVEDVLSNSTGVIKNLNNEIKPSIISQQLMNYDTIEFIMAPTLCIIGNVLVFNVMFQAIKPINKDYNVMFIPDISLIREFHYPIEYVTPGIKTKSMWLALTTDGRFVQKGNSIIQNHIIIVHGAAVLK